jgi:hypothetical protein
MNRMMATLSIVLLELFATPIAGAETPKSVQGEVEFLLDYVATSGCQFYRNGSWHDPKSAQAHLRSKYQYLAVRSQINSTEDFIEKAATQSSFSGQPYQVGCAGEKITFSNQWLRSVLVRFRASHVPR